MVIHVRPRGRHFFFAVDIPPGQLDETPATRQTRQTGFDESLSGQAVERYIYAFTAGRFENFLAEFGLTAIENMINAQRPQIRLLWSAGGGEHLRAHGVGQLYGSQSHAARSRVNENPVARLQSNEVE